MRHGCLTLIVVSLLALEIICSLGAQASDSLSGSVWGWGENTYGQLGNHSLNNSSLPVQALNPTGANYLAGVTSIAAGYDHSLALKSDGTVWSWGNNAWGQLGNNSFKSSNLPVQVVDPSDTSGHLTQITAIAAGTSFSLALKSDGTVRAWGYNSKGQLGNNSSNSSSVSVQVRDSSDASGYLTHVVAIAAGGGNSLALKSDGTVRAWGGNGYGNLGNNTFNNSSDIPVQVQDPSDSSGYLTHVVAIVAGDYHGLALKSDGTVRAWGDNTYGELGNNSLNRSSVPIQVQDPGDTSGHLTQITAIAAGTSFSLALKSDGTVRTWGCNSEGQLGNHSTNNCSLPKQVMDPAIPSQPVTNVATITAGGMHSLIGFSSSTRFDFNGDGYPDLVFENQATAAISCWLMNGTSSISTSTIHSASNPLWQIVAIADFNGDGHPDLIWQNQATAAISYWLMNGTSIISTGMIPGSSNPLWKIVGAADLNGDGHPDLIWQNQATGAVVYWLMDGTTRIALGTISSSASPLLKVVGLH